MTNFDHSDLRDPQPPIPGERERALVAARAHQLGRRRRLVQGGGALALVAAVAVSVAALTAGGSSGPGANHVEAASRSTGTAHTTLAPSTTTAVTTPATVATTVPAPDTTPATTTPPAAVEQVPPPTADTAPVTPATPSTFTLSGTVTGNPADTTAHLDFNNGEFTAIADGAGNYSVSGLPAGTYMVIGWWVDSSGTATTAVRMGSITISGDSTADFTF